MVADGIQFGFGFGIGLALLLVVVSFISLIVALVVGFVIRRIVE